MSLNEQQWFTEVCDEAGTAFALRVKEKVHAEESGYQRIEIYETEQFGTLMVIDGYVMLTERDEFIYHEMLNHPALFTHAGPRRVLIVGGGDCGTLREVLKHPGVGHVDMVEIDERVVRLSETHFPELCTGNQDPRAHIHFADGIQWVAEAKQGSYDVVIVDSTDPEGPAEGLFQSPFYAGCRQALDSGGVLAVQSESPMFHIDLVARIRREMGFAGFENISTLQFPQCTYPSGWWSVTLAGRDGPVDRFREDDARNRPFETRFYNADVHRAALVLPEFLRQALTRA